MMQVSEDFGVRHPYALTFLPNAPVEGPNRAQDVLPTPLKPYACREYRIETARSEDFTLPRPEKPKKGQPWIPPRKLAKRGRRF